MNDEVRIDDLSVSKQLIFYATQQYIITYIPTEPTRNRRNTKRSFEFQTTANIQKQEGASTARYTLLALATAALVHCGGGVLLVATATLLLAPALLPR